ncbi:unnamed protein product, partial [Didymodactylos carnosus]
NRIAARQNKKGNEHESEIIMSSYQNLNDFLGAFIDHSLTNLDYTIRERLLMERLLNYEFQSQYGDNLFYSDNDRNFERSIFAGKESSLFIWNMSIFLMVDYFAFNYVLAAIITYFLNKV